MTCSPSVLPRAGAVLLVGLLDSFCLSLRRPLSGSLSFKLLSRLIRSVTVYPRVDVLQVQVGPRARRSRELSPRVCDMAQTAGVSDRLASHGESESFAALRSLKLRTCCIARDHKAWA